MSANHLKILCVEDDPDIREICCLALELHGDAESQACGSGIEALALTATTTFDVILMDVMMPELDGAATLSRLRQSPRTAQTPVIFVTAKATRDELQRLTRLGATGVICKPFDTTSLLAQVRRLLASQRTSA
jgi:CheY-like chemotaxis protein